MDVENEALKSATKRIKKDKAAARTKNVVIVCASFILCTLIVCLTCLGIYTVKTQHDVIVEQQYALNMQYAGLLDWLSGAGIELDRVEYEANSGENGIVIAGDSNTVVSGGDLNGNGESH